MFPLGSVLFPHMPLLLRLFEPRYLQMLGGLLEDEQPRFGVVLIERGHEVGGGDHRFDVGTMARIVEVEAAADHMGVLAVGGQRFRVQRWLPDDPFPQANIEMLPELSWDAQLSDLHTQVEALVREALSVSSQSQYSAEVQLDADPAVSCWQLAAIVPVGPIDQLELLQSTSTEQLLSATGRLATEAKNLQW